MDVVGPGAYIALRTPSDLHKLVEIQPHTQIDIGKYGVIPTDCIIGRPYYLTYELVELADSTSELRVVSPAEQYAHIGEDEDSPTQTPVHEELLESNAAVNGAPTVGEPAPTNLVDTKTGFTRAKYQLKRSKRERKQFTVLPLDAPLLAQWLLSERRVSTGVDIRPEILAQMLGLANVHAAGDSPRVIEETGDRNRWLVVDESGGLLVAAVAERMGLLHHARGREPFAAQESHCETEHDPNQDPAMSATSNTITVVHTHSQANCSALSFFNYDASKPDTTHPIHAHLHTLNWLQLLHPEEDALCEEPPVVPAEELAEIKASKRGAYYRKRRRWQRIMNVIEATRQGGFSGLLVATTAMEATGILRHLVPLVRGGGQVVVYSPTIESVVELQDFYSTQRKAAYLAQLSEENAAQEDTQDHPMQSVPSLLGSEDFPVDPSLLLATTIQSVRSRPWQVLPGRTHPVMQDRGGADGYLFVGTRVVRSKETIFARGVYKGQKKRRVDVDDASIDS